MPGCPYCHNELDFNAGDTWKASFYCNYCDKKFLLILKEIKDDDNEE
jgi:hypothetical protein